MAEPARKWEVLEEPEPAPEKADTPPGIAVDLLALGLKTVSQRAITAITNLFTLVTMAGTWWLWYQTPDPNSTQIVSLSIFAAFVLAANWLVRRK